MRTGLVDSAYGRDGRHGAIDVVLVRRTATGLRMARGCKLKSHDLIVASAIAN